MVDEITQDHQKSEKSRLFCPLNQTSSDIFFSLVDYRNNYFTSEDPNKIIEFYNGFKNRYQLIQWMQERPKGVANIHEVGGNKDIIVVIPTADINGKYAKECRNNIFKGLHIIFVESGEIPDPYFNYAHNCNIGIKKGIEYNPKWLALSNDDVYKIDETETLVKQLSRLDNKNFDVIFTRDGKGKLNVNYRGELNLLGAIILPFLEHLNDRCFKKIFPVFNYNLAMLKNINIMQKIEQKKFGEYFHMGHSLIFSIFKKNTSKYYLSEYFGIYSADFLKRRLGVLFDETFLNANEDQYLSIVLSNDAKRTLKISFGVGSFYGRSLGNDLNRILRTIASDVYMNYKLSEQNNLK